jgi:hypothetical protein
MRGTAGTLKRSRLAKAGTAFCCRD